MKNIYTFLMLSSSFYLTVIPSESMLKRQQTFQLNRLLKIEEQQLKKENDFASKLSQHLPSEEFQNQAQKDSIQVTQEAVEKREQRIACLEEKLKQSQPS